MVGRAKFKIVLAMLYFTVPWNLRLSYTTLTYISINMLAFYFALISVLPYLDSFSSVTLCNCSPLQLMESKEWQRAKWEKGGIWEKNDYQGHH